MASTVSTSNFRLQWMPTEAIVRLELRSLLASWLVRFWFVATLLLTLLILTANWGESPTALMLQAMLFPYLVFPWFLVVMVLGISPVTGSRLDALSDSILSRPLTRYEYLLAAWAARVLVVLGVYTAVMLPAGVLIASATRHVPEDPVTAYGLGLTLILAGLVQTFLVTLGFLMGTLLRRPLLAAVVLVFTWLPINLVLSTFSLEQFSPFTLYQAVPALARMERRSEEAEEAEEASQSAQRDAEALAAQADQFMRLLSGQSAAPAAPQRSGFLEPRAFEELSVIKIMLGYGIPTLIALGMSLWIFQRRDL